MDPSSYSIANIFSLTEYDRIMILPNPGLVLNSKPFDSMLAFFRPRDGVAIYPLDQKPMYLLHPNRSRVEKFSSAALPATESDEDILQLITSLPEPLLSEKDPDYKPSLYMTLDELRTLKLEKAFNATLFFETTAFIRIEDSALPDPEFEIPYKDIVKNRPEDVDQAFIWENMYSLYKSRRYSVCGLDPRPLPQPEVVYVKGQEEPAEVKEDL
jgi:hypothetical protein